MNLDHWAPLERESPFKHVSKDFQHPIELDHRRYECIQMWQLTLEGKSSLDNGETVMPHDTSRVDPSCFLFPHQTTSITTKHTTAEELWNPNSSHLAADHFCPAGLANIKALSVVSVLLGPCLYCGQYKIAEASHGLWGDQWTKGCPKGMHQRWVFVEGCIMEKKSPTFWADIFLWLNCRGDKPLIHLTSQAQ